jgi:hypothetical protein
MLWRTRTRLESVTIPCWVHRSATRVNVKWKDLRVRSSSLTIRNERPAHVPIKGYLNMSISIVWPRWRVRPIQKSSTLEKLHHNTLDGIEISASLNATYASFSYMYSKQTRSMIDTMVRENSTILFTSTKVSCFKLSSFAPMMELSDSFRYVIKRLPCCSFSDRIQRFIFEYVFNYFGYIYVKDILLGGVVQQRITINEEERSNLVKNEVSTSHSMLAQFGFFSFSGALKANLSRNVDEEKLKTFRRYSKQSSITSLGGDTSIASIEEWS